MSKFKWYDATIKPYCYTSANTMAQESISYQNKEHHLLLEQQQNRHQTQTQVQGQKNIMKYFGRIIENINNNADNKQVCCLDLLINDIAKASLKQALTIEEVYNNNRIAGLAYCTYKTPTLLSSEYKI